MASETLAIDVNSKNVAGAVTDDSNQFIKMLRIDDTTKGLKVTVVGGSSAITIGTTTITSGTTTRILYDNAGVVGEYTISGTGTVVAMATSPSITTATLNGTSILADAAQISLTVPSVDVTATGFVTSAFNSGYSSTAVGDLMYLDSSATWQKTDADSTTTAYGLLGIALTVAASGAVVKVALPGSFVRVNAWNWTVGNTLYLGETAGAMQNTIPTGADNVIRVVAFAVNADYIYFYPSQDVQVTVA